MNNFFNLPFSAQKEEYDLILERVIESAKNNPSIISIYLMGGKCLPGISDLDLVVVYQDEQNPLRVEKSDLKNFDRIFTHRFLTFHKDDFKNFFLFYPTSTLKLIYGPELACLNPKEIYSKRDYNLLLMLNLIDYLIHKMAILPAKYKMQERVNVRQKLAELKSLAYDFEIIEALGREHQFGEYLSHIKALRESWFLNENNLPSVLEKLQRLGAESENAIFNLIKHLDYLITDYPLDFKINSNLFTNRKFSLAFRANYNLTNFKENRLGKKIIKNLGGRIFLNLPVNFLIVFIPFLDNYQTDFNQLVQNFLQKKTETRLDTKVFSDYALAKSQMFRRYVATNGFYRAPFMFGFSGFDFKHKILSRLITKILNLLKK